MDHRILKLSGLFAAITLFLAGLAQTFDFASDIKRGIFLGVGLAAVNGILNFVLLFWAFHKSNKAFFTSWVAGVFSRLIVFAGAAYFTYRFPAFDFLSTLMTLIFVTFILMFLEFEFLPKKTAGAHGL